MHWLLKTPELQENYLEVFKNESLVTLDLNSINVGNTTAIITPPSGKSFLLYK